MCEIIENWLVSNYGNIVACNVNDIKIIRLVSSDHIGICVLDDCVLFVTVRGCTNSSNSVHLYYNSPTFFDDLKERIDINK